MPFLGLSHPEGAEWEEAVRKEEPQHATVRVYGSRHRASKTLSSERATRNRDYCGNFHVLRAERRGSWKPHSTGSEKKVTRDRTAENSTKN